MFKQRLTTTMSWAVILSEVSHVFCCILPTLFSVMTLMAGLGLITVVPTFMLDWHEALHAYEIPIITASGVITALAWAVYLNANRVDCHSTGCGHEPCAPRKSRAHKVLVVGTVLFVINFGIFFFLHYLPEKGAYSLGGTPSSAAQAHDDHHDGHNDHDQDHDSHGHDHEGHNH